MADIILKPAALTAAAFAPFGDVIETTGHSARWINEGTCERFDDLAPVDVLAAAGLGAAVVMAVFLIAELRQSDPMLDLALFNRPAFVGVSVVAVGISASLS